MCGRGDTFSQSHLCSRCSETEEPVTVTRYNSNSLNWMNPLLEIVLNDVDTQHHKFISAEGKVAAFFYSVQHQSYFVLRCH